MNTQPMAVMGVRSAVGTWQWATCVPEHPIGLELLQYFVTGLG